MPQARKNGRQRVARGEKIASPATRLTERDLNERQNVAMISGISPRRRQGGSFSKIILTKSEKSEGSFSKSVVDVKITSTSIVLRAYFCRTSIFLSSHLGTRIVFPFLGLIFCPTYGKHKEDIKIPVWSKQVIKTARISTVVEFSVIWQQKQTKRNFSRDFSEEKWLRVEVYPLKALKACKIEA